ncbi:hypothetical protein [Massilia cavernae]|uniref:Uncharacterized protein n=1 Tax=Massilia cavernae TaxID=2320864 RepID=A0A418XT97_9BURK|nr:hypothetical protein [Massilia cavernae]RJG15802.1 hypothetical protein D3872_12215 [Massilia cavernae]
MARKLPWALSILFTAFFGAVAYTVSENLRMMRLAAVLAILPIFLLVWLSWSALVGGVVRQVTPGNAKLVPRLRARAIQLVGVCWILFTLAMAFGIGGMFGNKVLWAAGAGIWLAGAGLAKIGFQQRGGLLQTAPILLFVIPGELLKALQDFAATPAGIAACGVLLAVVAWYGKGLIFPSGDRHFTQCAAAEKRLHKSPGKTSAVIPEWMARGGGLYAACLARVSRGRTAPGEILLHALGPAAHWSASVKLLGAVLLVVLALRILVWPLAVNRPLTLGIASASAGWALLVMFIAGPQKIIQRVSSTPGEQALLRMTPAIPDMHSYNLQFANALFRRALAEWSLLAVALVGALLITGLHWNFVMLHVGACFLALPVTTLVLRDYAASPEIGVLSISGASVLLLAGGLIPFLVLYYIPPAGIAAACIAIGVAVTAFVAASRRRAMVDAPLAFPAGRLAG